MSNCLLTAPIVCQEEECIVCQEEEWVEKSRQEDKEIKRRMFKRKRVECEQLQRL